MQGGQLYELQLNSARGRVTHQGMALKRVFAEIAHLRCLSKCLLKIRAGLENIGIESNRPVGRGTEFQPWGPLLFDPHIHDGLAVLTAHEVQPGLGDTRDGFQPEPLGNGGVGRGVTLLDPKGLPCLGFRDATQTIEIYNGDWRHFEAALPKNRQYQRNEPGHVSILHRWCYTMLRGEGGDGPGRPVRSGLPPRIIFFWLDSISCVRLPLRLLLLLNLWIRTSKGLQASACSLFLLRLEGRGIGTRSNK